jgi:hypothetical protein
VATRTSAAFFSDEGGRHIQKSLIDSVANIVTDAAGKHFNPHVTTGVGTETYLNEMLGRPFASFTISAVGASVYQVSTGALRTGRAPHKFHSPCSRSAKVIGDRRVWQRNLVSYATLKPREGPMLSNHRLWARWSVRREYCCDSRSFANDLVKPMANISGTIRKMYRGITEASAVVEFVEGPASAAH